jgi:hypothetical protein
MTERQNKTEITDGKKRKDNYRMMGRREIRKGKSNK